MNNLDPHPIDPIALVTGLIAVIAGVIALLHQAGAISLGLPMVIVLGLLMIGAGGAALVVLESRRSSASAGEKRAKG